MSEGKAQDIRMSMRLGYVVPEFPGQTHIFFWRELQRLEESGVSVDIFSTSKPPRGIRPHAWSDEAEQRTTYLVDGRKAAIAAGLAGAVLQTSPEAWLRCLQSILRTQGSLKERAALVAMAVLGSKLAQAAKRLRWDHMHVHSCANAANIVAFASIISKIPYSLTLHGPLSDYGGNQPEKWGNAAFGVVITDKLRAEVEAALGPLVAQKIEVAPMGVNLNVFKRTEPYQCWSGEGPARLYSVGRLNPCKGHDNLIKAVGLLRQRGIDCRLTIAGEDEQGGSGYRGTLQRLIDELGLQQHVKLAGATSEAALRAGLLKSHVFALASLDEPLGVAIMEAMALEMPVVVSSGGGVKELIDDGEDGLLTRPGSPEDTARAIKLVLVERALAVRLAARSREKIRTKFQDTRSAEILVQRVAARPPSSDRALSARQATPAPAKVIVGQAAGRGRAGSRQLARHRPPQ